MHERRPVEIRHVPAGIGMNFDIVQCCFIQAAQYPFMGRRIRQLVIPPHVQDLHVGYELHLFLQQRQPFRVLVMKIFVPPPFFIGRFDHHILPVGPISQFVFRMVDKGAPEHIRHHREHRRHDIEPPGGSTRIRDKPAIYAGHHQPLGPHQFNAKISP